MDGVTNFLINFGPSLLFLFIVILSTIVGLIRGFRKSTILAIQALIAFVACIIIFVILAKSKSTDSNLVNIANTFLGEGGLQRRLSVSESSKTMTDILIEYIPKQMNYGDGIRLILAENGQYLTQLVFFAYRIILAVICAFIYLLLVFILYLIYLIFYPERRYKRKVIDKANKLESEKEYKKRPLLGMLIGLGRGLVSSIIILAFFGSILYMFAGTGKNHYKNDEVSFGNQEYDNYYSLYTSIGSYGTTGVYKVLNSIKVKDNMPFYLYAVDLVFSGNLNDTNRGVNTKFNFADEIGTYTSFARSTIDLLMKYGKEEITAVLKDNTNGDMLGTVLKVMGKPGFQEEYNRVIDDFNAKTFFVNFTLSLVDSIVAHIDELKLNDNASDAVDAISLLFKKDYLSPYIPEEKEILDRLETNPNYEYETRPYITASSLLTKDDTKSLLKALVASFSLDTTEEDSTEKILTYSTGIVPSISELSIFSDKRKDEMNGVLERMYVYLDNRYIQSALKTNESDETPNTSMADIQLLADTVEIDWCGEIKSLLNTAVDAIDIYKSVYKKDAKPLDMVTNILSPDNPMAESNEAKLDSIIQSISDSKLLDKVLSSKGMAKTIEKALTSIASEIYIPQLTYANTYNPDGSVKKYGETYNALNGVKSILKNQDLCDQVKVIQDFPADDPVAIAKFIKDFCNNLTSADESGKSIVNNLLESELLRSVLSGIIITHKSISPENGIEIYIPDSVLDTVDDVPVNMIDKTELNELVNLLADVVDIVIPYIDQESENYQKINPVVNNSKLGGLLENHIVNGTFVNVIVHFTNNEATKDFLVIPKDYETYGVEAWVEERELQHLITGIQSAAINFDTLVGDYSTDDERQEAIVNEIREIQRNTALTLLESNVLHYTISNFLATSELGGLQLIIPKSSRDELEDDNLEYLVKDTEIADLINNINIIMPEDFTDTNQLFKNIINEKEQLFESDIILTSVVNFIVNDTSTGINGVLAISDGYKEEATLDKLINITPNNIWRNEMPLLLDGIDVLLDLDNNPDLDMSDTDELSDTVMQNVKTLNDAYLEGTKLDVCYKSNVLITTLSEKISGPDVSVTVPSDALTTNEYLIDSVSKYEIAKLEVSRLIDVLNELDLDVTDANFSKVILNNTDILAVSKIFRATINHNLEGKDIIVPLEANENGYISEAEMKVFLKDLKQNQTIFFGEADEDGKVDITNPQVDASTINVNVLQTLIDSSIFYATIINQVVVIDNPSVNVPSYHNQIGEKEYLENNNLSDNLWYTTNEVEHLLDALELIIGANNAINGISEEIIIEKLKTLTDENIDMIYQSMVIKASITKALNNSLDGEINVAVRESNIVKYFDTDTLPTDTVELDTNEYYFYLEAEVKTLVKASKLLGIDLSDVDTSGITAKVKTLNDEYEEDTTKSKLDILYQSVIIKYIIANKVDDTLTESTINPAIRESDAVKADDGIKNDSNILIRYYHKDELEALIYALNELDLDLEAFDSTTIGNDLNDYNNPSTAKPEETRLELLYESVMIRYIIADKLDEYIDEEAISLYVRDSELVKTDDDIYDGTKLLKYYLIDEVSYLIISSNELEININSLTPIVIKNKLTILNDESNTDSNQTKLDIMYDSILIKYMIAKSLDDSLDSDIVNQAVKVSLNIRLTDDILDGSNNKIYYYKETEVRALVNGVNELEIDPETFDTSNINSKLDTFNNISTTDSSVTRLTVLYNSILIKYILAKRLDESITATVVNINVRESDSVKDNDGIYDDDILVKYYRYEEVSSLVDATQELNIDTTTFNTDNVDSQIKYLNNPSTINPDITKLDELYRSYIMKYIIADKLDEAFDSTVVNTAVRDSEKTKSNDNIYDNTNLLLYYLRDEVRALINSANEMNIEFTDSSFDSSSIIDNFNILNTESTITAGQTKLDIMYLSTIIKYIIADNLDDTLTSDVVKTSIRDSQSVKNSEDYILDGTNKLMYYFEAEVAALINALIDLDVDLNTFTSNQIADNVINLNNPSEVEGFTGTKLDVMYTSVIVRFIIANELDTNLTADVIEEAVKNSIEVKSQYITSTLGVDEYYYQINEVRYLIYSLTDLGLTNISDFSGISDNVLTLNEESTSFPGNSKLQTLYSGLITWHMVKKAVDDAVQTEIREDTYDYLHKIDTNITSIVTTVYSYAEVEALITAINSLGITTLDEISTLEIDDKLSTLDIDALFDSTITWDIVSVKFHDIIVEDTNPLIDHINAKYDRINVTDALFYLKEEVQGIQNLMIKSGHDSADDIIIDEIVIDDEGIEIIVGSHILLASLSDYMIVSSDIFVPAITFDRTNNNNYIYATEIELVLNAISKGMVDEYGQPATIKTVATGEMKPNQITDVDRVNQSIIMRASMTKHIKSTGTKSYVKNNEAFLTIEKLFEYDKTESEMDDLIILTGDEISNILTALDIYTGGESFEIEVSYEKLLTMTTYDLQQVTNSNLLCNIIANYILTENISGFGYNTFRTAETEFTYEINSVEYTYTFYEISSLEHRFNPSFETECYDIELGVLEDVTTLNQNDIVAYIAYLKLMGVTP